MMRLPVFGVKGDGVRGTTIVLECHDEFGKSLVSRVDESDVFVAGGNSPEEALRNLLDKMTRLGLEKAYEYHRKERLSRDDSGFLP